MANKEGFLKLSEAPFLKYLISFVIGILLQTILGEGYYIALPFALLSTILFFYYKNAILPKTKFVRRKYFAYATLSLFVAFGAIDAQLSSVHHTKLPEIRDYAIAQISEEIEIKQHSVECKALVIKLIGEEKLNKDFNVVLYIQQDSLSKNLCQGDIIIFEQNLQPIKFSKNPSSYSYSTTLEREGFYYSQYIPYNEWRLIDHHDQNSLINKSTEIRKRIHTNITNLNVSNSTKALISAMILGDTSLLSKEMRSSYSSSGLSHILAVSGLHIGIIGLIIFLMLYPLKWIKLSRIRPLITLLILWAYLFVIGFPPSAIRATIMASFVLFGEVINRKGTTINSLLAAALFMLIYNPNYIYNTSFQLSFIAVFSIFYIYPFIFSYLPHKNKLTNYLSSIMAVTLAAQIGTLPLSIYYFHQLPIIGLITNLLVIPILPVVAISAILAITIQYSLFTNTTDHLFGYIDKIAQYSTSIPYSSIDNIDIKAYYLVVIYIIIFGGLWAIKSKRSELVIFLLIFVSAFTILEKCITINKDNYKAIIYDDNRITAVNFVDEKYNYVLTIDTSCIEEKIKLMGKDFWIKEALPEAKFINDSIRDKALSVSLPYIDYKGEKYLILNSKEFEDKKLDYGKRLFVDKAIICNGFTGSITKLTDMFIFEEIIITSNVNYFKSKSIIKECKALKIPYYNIKEKGAYIIK
ncbi:MAG: ComEC/Rec2 family competence protein [Bacteroidales bacterium]|nr:ComEC/Rec2 family competence protein [Bacteroidales bacterium]